MKDAILVVKTIEITRAIRSAHLNGLSIKKKQAIGLMDGELLVAGNNLAKYDQMLAKMDLKNTEIITIYFGADTELAEAQQVSENIREKYPGCKLR